MMPFAELEMGTAAVQRKDDPLDSEATEIIRRALRGLRYGQVVVIVQDGVVIQVDRTEKRRLRLNGRG
jgi:hypothetical protein